MHGFITARPRFHAVYIAHERSLHCGFLRKIAHYAHIEEPGEQGRAKRVFAKRKFRRNVTQNIVVFKED
jgi:hypothetical protein